MTDFIWPSDQSRADSAELNRVCEYLERIWDERDELKAHQEALVGALTNATTALQVANFTTGTCCCGDNMDGHSYTSGHSPVDEGDHYQNRLLENCQGALERMPAVSLAEVKARAIEDACRKAMPGAFFPPDDPPAGLQEFCEGITEVLSYADQLRKEALNA